MDACRFIEISQDKDNHGYYNLVIVRYVNNSRIRHEYSVDNARINKIVDIIGRDSLDVDFIHGTIEISALVNRERSQ